LKKKNHNIVCTSVGFIALYSAMFVIHK